mmetsp:Transcript_12218/g.20118  ORF Transcript_12218/g.20118 Transcript_12218/m.20118 type:complete len:964 (+) Transcript_12218:294-3185(+)
MTAFGYQSGYHTPHLDDDSYPASFHYDTQHNLIYFTGVTYSTYFDKSPDINLPNEILGAMGMSMTAPSETTGSAAAAEEYHLNSPSCFVGILKLPPQNSAWWDNNNNNNNNHNSPPLKSPKLIYAKRFGTPQHAEACSSLLSLPASAVNDALLQSSSQLKLVLLGHVNPVPLSEEELEKLSKDLESGGLQRQRRLLEEMMMNDRGGNVQERFISVEEPNNVQIQQQQQQQHQYERSLDHPPTKLNQGGFFTSISHNNSNGGGPLAHNGRSYGFLIDFDVSLTPNPEFQTTASPTINLDMNNAYGALLGGYVLESSPLVYPIDLTQNGRDPNQLYVVSMHSDVETEVYNPEYTTSAEEEVNVELYERPDVTLGGAGGATTATTSSSSSSGLNVGGVPKFGSDFYVKVEQVTITPYEELLNVKPTSTEHVKQTMKSGWGFGFKLNDATDVRPSCVEFVKGRTPDEDLLLMGGTTRKKLEDGSGAEEYDGFITKIIPPTPAPVVDMTTGSTVEEAESGNIHNEGTHPTKRIDSTTGRDETVTAICLPPPDAGGMGVTHAFVVGSATNPEGGRNAPSVAYLLKMRLDDMSTVWKEHVTSISFDGGVGGDVLGQGCVVSRDGKVVYLSGTIDGSSGMRTGASNANVKPVGGVSDVFVVSYDVEFGNVKWEQQLGTEYEDKLARGGGIKVDNDGNPIIMGSTRGALQRSRDSDGRMASNVFFMNLSRENGAYINAPFTTGNVESASVAGSAFGSGSTAGVVVGIVVAVVFALLVIVVRRRRRTVRKEVSRMWDRNNDDDFSYDGNPSLGDEDKTSSGALRIVRRGSDGWDDGSDRINRDKDKHSFWKRISGGSEKKISSQPPNSRKDSDDHVSFLAKLREEASSSSKKVSSMISSDATDPRLDGGASIKNMLSQYREVKKESIVSGDGNRHAIPGKKTPRKSKPGLPPPPPPRRKYDGEPDGLSEFTIV